MYDVYKIIYIISNGHDRINYESVKYFIILYNVIDYGIPTTSTCIDIGTISILYL